MIKVVFFAGVVLVLMSFSTLAETKFTLSWQAPEARVDGSKLNADEIQGYNLQYQAPGEEFEYLQWAKLPPVEHSVSVPGEHCYQVSVKLKDGMKSDWSDVKCAYYSVLPVAPELNIIKVEWLDEN